MPRIKFWKSVDGLDCGMGDKGALDGWYHRESATANGICSLVFCEPFLRRVSLSSGLWCQLRPGRVKPTARAPAAPRNSGNGHDRGWRTSAAGNSMGKPVAMDVLNNSAYGLTGDFYPFKIIFRKGRGKKVVFGLLFGKKPHAFPSVRTTGMSWFCSFTPFFVTENSHGLCRA